MAEGHHLASHTWSHHALTTLTKEQIVAEVKWTEKAVMAVTGVQLKYLRPPFGDINNRVRFVLRKMGYVVVEWTGDTFSINDWQLPTITESSIIVAFTKALDAYVASPKTTGYYAMETDLNNLTVLVAQKLIPLARARSIQMSNVALCQNDAPYQSRGTSPTSSATSSGPRTNPATPVNQLPGASNKESSSSTGLIAGIVVALVVVAVVLGFVILRRKKRLPGEAAVDEVKPDAAVDEVAAKCPQSHFNSNSGNYSDSDGSGQKLTIISQNDPHRAQEMKQNEGSPSFSGSLVPQNQTCYQPQQQQLQLMSHSSYSSQPHGAYFTSDAGTATQSFQHPTSSLPTPPPESQFVHSELQQEFQLSAHPRPSIITTVRPPDAHGGARGEGSETLLPSVPRFWQPKPFMPPDRDNIFAGPSSMAPQGLGKDPVSGGGGTGVLTALLVVLSHPTGHLLR